MYRGSRNHEDHLPPRPASSVYRSFPLSPSPLPSPSPPPTMLAAAFERRSYCLASAFGIMHNSMARGLRVGAVCIGYRFTRSIRRSTMMPVIGDSRGRGLTYGGEGGGIRARGRIFVFVRAPRKTSAALSLSTRGFIVRYDEYTYELPIGLRASVSTPRRREGGGRGSRKKNRERKIVPS